MGWIETVVPKCEGENGEFIHSHQNLNLLRSIDGTGLGDLFLSDDGTFKVVVAPGAAIIVKSTTVDVVPGDLLIVDNEAAYFADKDNASHKNKIKYFCVYPGLIGESITMTTAGTISKLGWGLTPNVVHFVGNSGQVVDVPPTAGFVQIVGQGITTDTLAIEQSIAVTL